MSMFKEELKALINRHSKENDSDTPDFILVEYLTGCLKTFEEATAHRDKWHGFNQRITAEGPTTVQGSFGPIAPEDQAAFAPDDQDAVGECLKRVEAERAKDAAKG